MQGDDRSQMAMFMDYSPKVVFNYEHMKLLAAACHIRLCYSYGNMYWIWRYPLVYI